MAQEPDQATGSRVAEKDDAPDGGLMKRAVTGLGLPFSMIYVLAMGILIYEIIMRYVFHAPTLWVHETTTFLSAVGFIFGGLYCVSLDRHIRIVMVYDAVGPKVRRWLDLFINGACALSAAAFAYAAWKMTEKSIFTPSGSFRLETSGTAWNAPYPALLKLFLFVVLIFISLQFSLLFISKLRRGS